MDEVVPLATADLEQRRFRCDVAHLEQFLFGGGQIRVGSLPLEMVGVRRGEVAPCRSRKPSAAFSGRPGGGLNSRS